MVSISSTSEEVRDLLDRYWIGCFLCCWVSISSTSEEVRDSGMLVDATTAYPEFPLVPLPKKCVTPKSHIHIIARIPTIDREGS